MKKIVKLLFILVFISACIWLMTDKSYARNNYICGDVNLDGKVTSKDRTYLARYLAGWKDYETLPVAK